ncbi:hypothetical protein L3N51_01479 [Metallosphaera sp. J1]|uniref:hypothetical protein n=1 Tax=Metallosphaera javensis (ex Hofmann et al. 2022) TaxID=99938 RepID=UPI001EE03EFC|nr:hypothetical protein [Metallosphaera javensis (ex Hofmann et al. 2022)]MCG3109189.1 hypothetical protein [Metallosphaera javensis (ex Hofmann et al. 2022)]
MEDLLNNQEFIEKVARAVLERIKNEVVISSLEEVKDEVGELKGDMNGLKKDVGELKGDMNGLKKDVGELKEELKVVNENGRRQGERLDRLETLVTEHGAKLDRLEREMRNMRWELKAYTSRGGVHMERAMLNLYREALLLHGINPSGVKHGEIEDEKGLIVKGRKFEIDFYEEGERIYVFEIKTNCSKDDLDQLIVRRKLVENSSSLGGKEIIPYLVCNVISRRLMRMAEEDGIRVIAGTLTGRETRRSG